MTRRRLVPAAGIVAATFLCYGGLGIRSLGFYHDDWALISVMSLMHGGIWETAIEQLRGTAHAYRPLAVLCWTVPYRLFGLNAALWQCAMASLSAAVCLAFYRLLRSLGGARVPAVLAALLFLCFPNKDATLFWPVATLQLSCSLLCFLLACLLQASYVRSGRASRLAGAVILLMSAVAVYEQCFFLLPVWALAAGGPGSGARVKKSLLAGGSALLLFAACKFIVLPRYLPYNKSVEFSAGHALYVGYAAVRALSDPRWIVYLARCAWQAVLWHPFLSIASFALPWLVLAGLGGAEEASAPEADRRRLLAWGAAVYVLGYLPFCFSDYAPTAYDHMNRMNQLPAAGVCAALCGWASAPNRRRRALGLAAAAGTFLVVHLAFSGIWRESYRRQMAIKDLVLSIMHRWPRNKSLLLVLPEAYAARKAPVFLSNYDISAAIHLWSGDPGRAAHVYGEWTRFDAEGLSLPGNSVPYRDLLMLDAASGRLSALDARSARSLPPVLMPWEKSVVFWPED